ncbi:MAG: hypothetical protein ACTH5D_15390 [Halomonas sp.]|uniref:hypothetical protein n=1 Tax=Halomonas sp. TaxID=1486246 RepID=UPI003F901BE4
MLEIPLTWQLAKLGLSISMVLGLGAIATRTSPRTAGLLAGYPLGTSLTLFFIGLEISPAFATQSATHTLAGFTSTIALGAGYLVAGGRQPGIKGMASGVAGGFIAWFAASSLLTQFDFSRLSGTLVTLCAIGVFSTLFRAIPDVKSPASRAFSLSALAARACLATVIVFTITRLAHWLPPAWAGTLAAFPVTMLPFLLILHLSHGMAPVATVIKHFPMGLGSLLSYTLCVSYTFSSLGLWWGTLTGFAAATLWLLGWMQLTAWYQRRTP